MFNNGGAFIDTLRGIKKKRSQRRFKNLAFKVTKSIDFTMLLVRGWIVVKPLTIMQTLKIMIMIDVKSILNTVKSRMLKFIESIVVGLALVVERVGLIL